MFPSSCHVVNTPSWSVRGLEDLEKRGENTGDLMDSRVDLMFGEKQVSQHTDVSGSPCGFCPHPGSSAEELQHNKTSQTSLAVNDPENLEALN